MLKPIDLLILAPAFLVTAVCFFAEKYILQLEDYPFLTWLTFVVFIDVGHVYATYIKLYQEKFITISLKFLGFLAVLLWAIGIILFLWSSQVFWSVMAYFAVFHFVKQQYGLMRFYSRSEKETTTNTQKNWDKIVIYTATIYPMVFWFLSPPRQFNWFMENEFFHYKNPELLNIFTVCYWIIVGLYALQVLFEFKKSLKINVEKHLLIIGTFLSWYVGIVYFNHDIIFTILNVICHGVPYMAFVYKHKNPNQVIQRQKSLNTLSTLKSLILFILPLVLLGFSEEFLWENLVWKEHIEIVLKPFENLDFSSMYFLLIPLLSLPQLLHYTLDGIIWKKSKSKKYTI